MLQICMSRFLSWWMNERKNEWWYYITSNHPWFIFSGSWELWQRLRKLRKRGGWIQQAQQLIHQPSQTQNHSMLWWSLWQSPQSPALGLLSLRHLVGTWLCHVRSTLSDRYGRTISTIQGFSGGKSSINVRFTWLNKGEKADEVNFLQKHRYAWKLEYVLVLGQGIQRGDSTVSKTKRQRPQRRTGWE